SAKTSELQITGIREIQNIATKALDIMEAAAVLEASTGDTKHRLMHFLRENKALLVVDNYETIVGNEIAELAEEVPGESKILFTSRKPIGSDLTVLVGEFSPQDAEVYFRRLVDAYAAHHLTGIRDEDRSRYLRQLSYKPLLIKWFVLGVQSGLQPERIVAAPETALRFCLDNVILNLGEEAQAVMVVLATLPSRASPGVMAHVGRLSPTQVADGLAEVSRMGLVDAAASDEGSQVFGIRAFARSYVHRLIPPRAEITEKILANYRRLEADFQEQRSQASPALFKAHLQSDFTSSNVSCKKAKTNYAVCGGRGI
ncbi:MAG TPA: hypothetical protein VEW25_13360, partial [Allosphingosinicella sp.]|nr:hypothetical protein [Allosphingosinicella sp.]